ncbi:hypothetical protein F1880_001958 [Penicillium rolfsii]|nr:hypothetical protein F1880_001958 [Penicillium rolfsii]
MQPAKRKFKGRQQQEVSRTKPKVITMTTNRSVKTCQEFNKHKQKHDAKRVIQVSITLNEKNQEVQIQGEKKEKDPAERKPFEAKRSSIWLLDREREETDKGN